MANVTPETKEEQDRAYSPEEIQRREQEHESIPGYDRSADGLDDHPISAGVADAEENPTTSRIQEFANNFTGKNNKKAKSFFSGKGPILAIGGGVGGAGLILLTLLVPGILLFHVLANAFDTLDPSSTALSQVAKMMLLSKLGANSSTFTQGVCGPVPVTIACKFKTPSNDLLRQLKENGVTALNESGKEIPLDGDGKWPAERPAQYKISSFHSSSGDELIVKASELKGTLQENRTLDRAVGKIIKNLGSRAFSRFSPAFLKVISKFDFGLRDKLNIKQRVTTKAKTLVTDLLEKALKSTVGEGTAETAKALVDSISLRIGRALDQLAKVSKGSGIVLAMAIQCMVNQMPGMLKKALAATQEASAVNMAAPMVTAISAIKVGDGDPETASEIGTIFTEKDANGKTMLDSAGMHYTLYGDKDVTDDPTFKTVTPDAYGPLKDMLNVTDAVFNNPLSYTACAALMNPIGGAAIAATINAVYTGTTSVETFGLSLVVNLVIGGVASVAINQWGDGLGEMLGNMISPGIGEIAKPVVEQMAQPGQTRGNVFAYGVGAITTNTGANTFGNYLTTDELSAYTQDIQAKRLADARLDRETLSPFDTSSQYTFLGSMVNQLVPYYSSFSSVGGSVSVLGSLLPISIGSIFNLSTAHAADASIYQNACYDPVSTQTVGDNEGKVLATNLFCQPVPASLIPDNWDPSQSLQQMQGMVSNGVSAIDSETGAPTRPDNALQQTAVDYAKSLTDLVPGSTVSYYEWLDSCTNPEYAAGCTSGDNATLTTYSLYTAARTVNVMLDNDAEEAQKTSGEDPKTTPPPTSGSANTALTPTDTTSAPSDGSGETTDTTETPDSTQESTTVEKAVMNSLSAPQRLANLIQSFNATFFPSRRTNQLAVLGTLERFTLWR